MGRLIEGRSVQGRVQSYGHDLVAVGEDTAGVSTCFVGGLQGFQPADQPLHSSVQFLIARIRHVASIAQSGSTDQTVRSKLMGQVPQPPQPRDAYGCPPRGSFDGKERTLISWMTEQNPLTYATIVVSELET